MLQKIAFAPSQDQQLIVEDDIEEGAVHVHATVVKQTGKGVSLGSRF
jgi:hypothetical protein